MAMHVTKERLFSAVHHLDRPSGVQRQQAHVHLQAHVLATAERATHAREREPHFVVGQAEARGDLITIDMQPLRRDVQLDPAVVGRNRQTAFGSHEGLVLHTDFVDTFDGHGVGRQRRVDCTVTDTKVTNKVAIGMDRVGVERSLGVDERNERFVLDDDRLECSARGLWMVGGDRGDGLAVVAHDVAGKDRLISMLESVERMSRDVFVGQRAADAGYCESGRDIEAHDAR
jgi:hypothetical protein